MKLASVIIEGVCRFGAITERGFVDFTEPFQGRCSDLRSLLSQQLLDEAQSVAKNAPVRPLEGLIYQPVIPNLDARMFAVGWAYKDHQVETGKAAPKHPFLFSKHPQSMVGHEQALQKPRVSDRFDFEGEVVLIIGRAGRYIDPANAMEHIAGYSIGMDGSVRDWQEHSVTAGKNFDASSAYGPWLVTSDEISEPGKMKLTTRLNGEVMQSSDFSLMAWGIPELVAYVSSICRLEPGDSISTGTPSGVGNKRNPPVYMAAGDTLEVELTQVGILRNPVINER